MKIKKIKGTYNDYSVELSFGQIQAIKDALASDHANPVADELYAELVWYLDNIPGPGEDEEDLKKAEEADDSELASPDAEGQPLRPKSADTLLPLPGDETDNEGRGEEGPEPDLGSEGELLEPGEALEPEEAPEPTESEADQRLPRPPED